MLELKKARKKRSKTSTSNILNPFKINLSLNGYGIICHTTYVDNSSWLIINEFSRTRKPMLGKLHPKTRECYERYYERKATSTKIFQLSSRCQLCKTK